MIAPLVLILIDFVISIVEGLIGLRVILKLFGAFSGAPFVNWVYETTNPLLQPFSGMFPSPRIEGRFVIEFSALFALIIYALAGYLLTAFVRELGRFHKISRKV